MVKSFKPRPRTTVSYLADVSAADAKPCREIGSPCFAQTDFAHRLFRKFCVGVPRTTEMRPVDEPIGSVFYLSLPYEVLWSAAASMAITALVRGDMFRGWCRPMHTLANKFVNIVLVAIDHHRSVSAAVARIGPKQAIVTVIGQDNVAKILRYFTPWRSPSERITVLPPADVMIVAPATRNVRLAAFRYRAYTKISHFDLYNRLAWLERAGVVRHSARSLFLA
jgi:hypothetical protein